MKQKVFITKYALTKGIEEVEMEVRLDTRSCYGRYNGYISLFYNNEFHLTKEDALRDAEKRRVKKIESLKKQIEKLECLSF